MDTYLKSPQNIDQLYKIIYNHCKKKYDIGLKPVFKEVIINHTNDIVSQTKDIEVNKKNVLQVDKIILNKVIADIKRNIVPATNEQVPLKEPEQNNGPVGYGEQEDNIYPNFEYKPIPYPSSDLNRNNATEFDRKASEFQKQRVMDMDSQQVNRLSLKNNSENNGMYSNIEKLQQLKTIKQNNQQQNNQQPINVLNRRDNDSIFNGKPQIINSQVNDMSSNIENLEESINTNFNTSVMNNIQPQIQRLENPLILNPPDDPKAIFMNNSVPNSIMASEIKQINEPVNSITKPNPVLIPERPNSIVKQNYVIVDSLDRDVFLYPNSTNFQVQFRPASEERISPHNPYMLGSIIVQNSNAANVPTTFENIVNMECSKVIMPKLEKQICDNEQNFVTRNFNEQYLVLNIEELEPIYVGTNSTLNKAFEVFIYEDDFGNDAFRFAKYKPIIKNKKLEHYPTFKSNINKLTLDITSKRGNTITATPDLLYVSKIIYDPSTSTGSCSDIYIEVEYSPSYTCATGTTIKEDDQLFFYITRPCEGLNNSLYFDTSKFNFTHSGNQIIVDANPDVGKLSEIEPLIEIPSNKQVLYVKYDNNQELLTTDFTIDGKTITSSAIPATIGTVHNVGFKQLTSGDTNNKKTSLNYSDGHFVCCLGYNCNSSYADEGKVFKIEVGYDCLPRWIKDLPEQDSGIISGFKEIEIPPKFIYLLQAKKQVELTFLIENAIKDSRPLESNITN